MQKQETLSNTTYLLEAGKTIAIAFVASLFMGVISQFTVPFYPVPITLQTLGVYLIGLAFSPSTAFLSLIFYLGECSMSLPFLSGGQIDPAWMVTTRAGYLVAFPIAAFFISKVHRSFQNQTYLTAFLAVLVGKFIILGCGVAYLSTFIGFEKAIVAGFLPFLYSGFVKAFFAVTAGPFIERLKR